MFRTVEVNGIFYSMQRPSSFAGWVESTPDDFVFAIKGPRFLTHMKRLNEPRTDAAVALGRRHDHRLKARAWLRPRERLRLRHALESRHESFRDPAFVELLRRHDIALVCADTVEWPLLMDLTSDFVYCRLHGSRELYRSGYSAAELTRWVRRIRAWRDGKPMRDGTFVGAPAKAAPRDVFVYFDNTDKLRAPHDAQGLMRCLGEA